MVKEGTGGVEGPLKYGRVAGHDEAIVRVKVKARQEAAHVHYFHYPVDFHKPRPDNGVDHEIEDSW